MHGTCLTLSLNVLLRDVAAFDANDMSCLDLGISDQLAIALASADIFYHASAIMARLHLSGSRLGASVVQHWTQQRSRPPAHESSSIEQTWLSPSCLAQAHVAAKVQLLMELEI